MAEGDPVGPLTQRARLLGWLTTIVVAIGVVAAIPMLPILVIGLLFYSVRSPAAGFGVLRAMPRSKGRLESFSGALLFPMVAAGWLLIGLLIIGLAPLAPLAPVGGGVLAIFGVAAFVGPPYLAYRSIYPSSDRRRPFGAGSWRGEVPSDPLERLGRAFDRLAEARTPGSLGCLLILWFPLCVFVAFAIVSVLTLVAVPVLRFLVPPADLLGAVAVFSLGMIVGAVAIFGLAYVAGLLLVIRNARSGSPIVDSTMAFTAIVVADVLIVAYLVAARPTAP